MAEENENINNPDQEESIEEKTSKEESKSGILNYAIMGILGIFAIYGGYVTSKYILVPNYEEEKAHKLEQEMLEDDLMAPLNRAFGIAMEFKDIMVNPMGSRGQNVVQVSFVVEATDPSVVEELNTRKTQLQDLFISYLRNHTVDQLASMEFQIKSKDELQLEINKMLNAGNIDSIYYSGFFIQ